MREKAPDTETRLVGDHGSDLRLWLRMLACANLIESEVRGRLRGRFDVTLPRFDLMAQLERSPDGLTLGELSRQMMVSNGNITGLVERLVESGHIVRAPHPNDRRVSIVRLTELGRAEFATMAAEHGRWIADMFSGVSREDRDMLLRLLGQLRQSVRARSALA